MFLASDRGEGYRAASLSYVDESFRRERTGVRGFPERRAVQQDRVHLVVLEDLGASL